MGLFEEPAEGYLFKAYHDALIYALQLQNLCCFSYETSVISFINSNILIILLMYSNYRLK